MFSEKEVNLAVRESIDIIKYGDRRSGFSTYSRGFFATTECIKEYLERVEFAKTRALTVLSCGDQIFNLVHNGVKEIDAFDINTLQYYVYQLRLAMLKNYSYKDFVMFNVEFANGFSVSYEFIEIVKKLKESLPDDVYHYYRSVLDYSLKFRGLNRLYMPVSLNFTCSNNYLASEEDYLFLRKQIEEVQVNISFGSVLDIVQFLDKKYSIILLSNIADYLSYDVKKFGIKEFRKYIKLFEDNLLKNGVIVNYMYGAYDSNSSVIRTTRSDAITPAVLGEDNVFKIESYPHNLNHEAYYLVRKR